MSKVVAGLHAHHSVLWGLVLALGLAGCNNTNAGGRPTNVDGYGSAGAAGAAGAGAAGTLGGGGQAGTVSPTAGTSGQPSSSDPLPCAVAQALITNCQKCHGTTPIGGAPMSLVHYSDFTRPAHTVPNLTVAQLAQMRLNDKVRPMPPGGTISAADLSTLNNWLAAGAPAGTAADLNCMQQMMMAQPDGGVPGPQPGETCYELQNHDLMTPGDKTPYVVSTGEHYEQFYFKVPWPAGSSATRFGAKFDNLAVLHHWLLFTSSKSVSLDGTHETVIGTQLGDSSQLLAGWAVGGDDVTMPSDMELELPDSGLLNLQWHFFNSTGAPANDATPIVVCTVPKGTRPHLVSMTWLGTENFNGPFGMPAHTKSSYSGTCPNDSGAPITIWSFWPHMHNLGRHMSSVVHRNNGMAETVFSKDFDFNHQVHYVNSPMVVLAPGETITSTCDFDNTTDKGVPFGPSTTQEMCYQFAYSYPAKALDNGVASLIGATNTCW